MSEEKGYEIIGSKLRESSEYFEAIELINRGFTSKVPEGDIVEFDREREEYGSIKYRVKIPGEPTITVEKEEVRILEGLETVSENAAATNLVDKYLEELEVNGTDPDQYQEERLEPLLTGDKSRDKGGLDREELAGSDTEDDPLGDWSN